MSDDADDWVLSHASIPKLGTLRPASSLGATFGGLPIDGEWKISISMARPVYYPEESHKRLLDWELTIGTKPCAVAHPRWQKLPSPPSGFSPRRLHTAVAVGNSIFIFEGFAKHCMNDMWCFNFDTKSWTDLIQHGAVDHGLRCLYMGKHLSLALSDSLPMVAWESMVLKIRLDLFEGYWVSVPISQQSFAHDNESFK